jgi:hypothetical protein
MTLNVGTRLGPYEIVSAIGAGGAPAARARREAAECERAGVGPREHKKMSACGHAAPRLSDAEAMHQRQYAAGVGPRRQ